MCENRAARGGKATRKLFHAQVQLSRSLLAGRRDARTDCPSAEDSSGHCSPTSRDRQQDSEDDDVSRLPDTVVVDHLGSGLIGRLTKKKRKKHEETLKQFESELIDTAQVCQAEGKNISLELLSSLQESDLRLNGLKDKMEHVEHVSLQEVHAFWEEVEEELKIRRIRLKELNNKLTATETERTDKIRAALQRCCHLLEKTSFLPPSDICRLIHSEAMMLNQSVLANWRSVAQLLFLLHMENLQQASLLRLHWEDCLSCWKRSRVDQIIDRFRQWCRSEEEQQLSSVQLRAQKMTRTQNALTEQRSDIISRISSLHPPSCSTPLVCDWFNQLTAVNQQIESFHADSLHQLRCCYEQKWQDRLAELENCKERLSALQLSEEELNNIVALQILTLIGQIQTQEEERLAALDLLCDSVASRAVALSRCVFVVLRGAASLWETHKHTLQKREEVLQQQLDDLRGSHQQHIQSKMVRLDNLLAGLRQGSNEDSLKTSLGKVVRYLREIKQSCSECVSDQCQLLDQLPSVRLEELLSYSSSLSSFYRLDHTYTPSAELLQDLPPPSSGLPVPDLDEEENQSTGLGNDGDPSPPSCDWLTEAETSLLELCDITSDVTFTSSRGSTYAGPAFRCPAPDLQHGSHLSLFPVELLTHTLSRTRTLFLEHLEQHVHDALSSAFTKVTDWKENVRLEQELRLKHLNPEHIQRHVYQPRLAELQLHRQRVDDHCEEVLAVLASCREELQELQGSIVRKNEEFSIKVSNMERDELTAASSQRLDAVSAALQDCVDEHIKHCQLRETGFRRSAHNSLQEVRNRTTRLLGSFRLFSEGGDFAPEEVKLFQKRLKEESKEISVTEESIFSDLEAFLSSSLQQVKEVTAGLEEKLPVLKSELSFTAQIHKILSRTQVQLRAEAASSNQQHSSISRSLDDLKGMMEDPQVCPDQVCSHLSSLNMDLRRRCHYLDLSVKRLLSCLKPRNQVRPAPSSVALEPGRAGVDLLDDPVVSVIRSLTRLSTIQDAAAEPDTRLRSAVGSSTLSAGQSPVQLCQQRGTETVSTPRVRRGRRTIRTERKLQFFEADPDPEPEPEPEFDQNTDVKKGCSSIRTNRRFQVFGAEPDPDPNTGSYSSRVTSVLWITNDDLLLIGEEFYRSERPTLTSFLLLPDTLHQWADSMQQKLLGYYEQTRNFLSTSREDLLDQLSVLEELLRWLISVLIGNHERWQRMQLMEEVGGVKAKLEEMLMLSEKEKRDIVRQLRASLSDDELQRLNTREELRQQTLHDAICQAHLQLEERVRVRGAEFVTSLAALTENLLHQMDDSLIPAETGRATTSQQCDNSSVTMETEDRQSVGTAGRTWSGITYFSPPVGGSDDPASSVATATTASITATRCTMGHVDVIEQRDAAVKRFEQLFSSELSRSRDDRERRLGDLQRWNKHWNQQLHTLTHTHAAV